MTTGEMISYVRNKLMDTGADELSNPNRHVFWEDEQIVRALELSQGNMVNVALTLNVLPILDFLAESTGYISMPNSTLIDDLPVGFMWYSALFITGAVFYPLQGSIMPYSKWYSYDNIMYHSSINNGKIHLNKKFNYISDLYNLFYYKRPDAISEYVEIQNTNFSDTLYKEVICALAIITLGLANPQTQREFKNKIAADKHWRIYNKENVSISPEYEFSNEYMQFLLTQSQQQQQR